MSDFSREAAWQLLNKYNKEQFRLKHAVTVEGVMKYFAEKLGLCACVLHCNNSNTAQVHFSSAITQYPLVCC